MQCYGRSKEFLASHLGKEGSLRGEMHRHYFIIPVNALVRGIENDAFMHWHTSMDRLEYCRQVRVVVGISSLDPIYLER